MLKFILNSWLNLDLLMLRHNFYEAEEFNCEIKKYFSIIKHDSASPSVKKFLMFVNLLQLLGSSYYGKSVYLILKQLPPMSK